MGRRKKNWGSLASVISINLIVFGLMLLREKDFWNALIIIGATILCYGIALLINIWTTVDFNLVGVISLSISTLYLIVLAIIQRKKSIGWIATFVIISTVLCQGCDYAFHIFCNLTNVFVLRYC